MSRDRQQVKYDNLQAQQPANNTSWVRRSSRAPSQPDRFVPNSNNVVDYVMVTECSEPSCFKEAMVRQDKKSYEVMLSCLTVASLKKISWKKWHLRLAAA